MTRRITVRSGPVPRKIVPPASSAVVAGGADTDAIHDNVSSEISAITEKTTPVSADLVVIEDSAASYVKKKLQIGNLAESAQRYGADFTLAVDAIPGSPDGDDDEFDDASISGWTSLHAGTAPTWTEDVDEMLRVYTAAEAGWNLKTQHKALPGSGDWTYVLKLGPCITFDQNFHKPGGIALLEGTTTSSDVYLLSRSYNSGWKVEVTHLTGFTTYSSTPAGLLWSLTPHWPLYLRIEKVGSTYTFSTSVTGESAWYQIYSSTLAFTPTRIGPVVNVENATFSMETTFAWFRRTV